MGAAFGLLERLCDVPGDCCHLWARDRLLGGSHVLVPLPPDLNTPGVWGDPAVTEKVRHSLTRAKLQTPLSLLVSSLEGKVWHVPAAFSPRRSIHTSGFNTHFLRETVAVLRSNADACYHTARAHCWASAWIISSSRGTLQAGVPCV